MKDNEEFFQQYLMVDRSDNLGQADDDKDDSENQQPNSSKRDSPGVI